MRRRRRRKRQRKRSQLRDTTENRHPRFSHERRVQQRQLIRRDDIRWLDRRADHIDTRFSGTRTDQRGLAAE